jgi:nucleoside-diphosphate-sugar epimerase
VRTPRPLPHLRAAGVEVLVFDGRRATVEVEAVLRGTTHLITTAAPDDDRDPVLRCCRALLLHGMPALRWIGYLSTTGVYGDHDGAWVDEQSACWPDSARTIRRLAVEQEWQEVAELRRLPLAVLRLSGIYGPGRNALASLAAGTAVRVAKPGHWFSRVHVADVAGATALLARQQRRGIFNVSDDMPAAPGEVMEHAASLLGSELPPEVPLDSPLVSPGLRSFYTSNRRVSNHGIRAAGYAFRYPDYRAGLDALWRRGDWREAGSAGPVSTEARPGADTPVAG